MDTPVRQLREGDRVVLHADPDGRGTRPVFGVVNLPYTRADGTPGRTIEVVLETPVEVDDGIVRCIYTTADHVRLARPPISLPVDHLADNDRWSRKAQA